MTTGKMVNLRGQLNGMQSRLNAIEQSRDQAILQAGLLSRDLETERTRTQDAIDAGRKVAIPENSSLLAVIADQDARISALESLAPKGKV